MVNIFIINSCYIDKKEFLKKRKEAYQNEFKLAQQLAAKCHDEEDENEESLMNETLKNTLFNKFYGQINK